MTSISQIDANDVVNDLVIMHKDRFGKSIMGSKAHLMPDADIYQRRNAIHDISIPTLIQVLKGYPINGSTINRKQSIGQKQIEGKSEQVFTTNGNKHANQSL